MPWSVTLNGRTYTDADFAGLNYTGNLFLLIADMAAHVAGAGVGTSGSSMTIGTGSKSLVIVGTGFSAGQPIRLVDAGAPTTNLMDGELSVYNAETGAATVEVSSVRGNGTFTAWLVMVGSALSTAVATPVPIADGGSGASTARQAVINFGIVTIRRAQTRENAPSALDTGVWFVVGPAATGAWAGHNHEWASYDGVSWSFETPMAGDVAIVEFDYINGSPTRVLPNYGSILTFDGAWITQSPGSQIQGGPSDLNAGNVTLVAGDFNSLMPLTIGKNNTSARTLTLPTSAGNWGASSRPWPDLWVINDGASADITVNVSSSGTVNGSSSIAITPGSAKLLRWTGASGKWRAL